MSTSKIQKNWLEWTVFGVSVLLVLSTIGYLGFAAATYQKRPAKIEVKLGKPRREADRLAVPAIVVNSGDEPAESLVVRVKMPLPNGGAEHAELHIQHLPGSDARRGWLIFNSAPDGASALSVQSISFTAP